MDQIYLTAILLTACVLISFAIGFYIGHQEGYLTSCEERQEDEINY